MLHVRRATPFKATRTVRFVQRILSPNPSQSSSRLIAMMYEARRFIVFRHCFLALKAHVCMCACGLFHFVLCPGWSEGCGVTDISPREQSAQRQVVSLFQQRPLVLVGYFSFVSPHAKLLTSGGL